MKRYFSWAVAAFLAFSLPALAADPTFVFKDASGATMTITITPGGGVVAGPPAAPTTQQLIEQTATNGLFTLPPGVTKGYANFKKSGGSLRGDPGGTSVLDCNTTLAMSKACITSVIDDVNVQAMSFKGFAVANGFGAGSEASDGDACLRLYGAMNTVTIEDAIFAYCSNGIHGPAKFWNLNRVKVYSAGNKGDGKSHGIYIQNCDTLTIENSVFDTQAAPPATPGLVKSTAKAFGAAGNGHQVKSGCKNLVIRNTTIIDSGAANSGEAINAYAGGDVLLENVTIHQKLTVGQRSILSNGDVERCKWGPGTWTFRNVKITDDNSLGRVRWICGAPKIVLEGTNEIPPILKIVATPVPAPVPAPAVTP